MVILFCFGRIKRDEKTKNYYNRSVSIDNLHCRREVPGHCICEASDIGDIVKKIRLRFGPTCQHTVLFQTMSDWVDWRWRCLRSSMFNCPTCVALWECNRGSKISQLKHVAQVPTVSDVEALELDRLRIVDHGGEVRVDVSRGARVVVGRHERRLLLSRQCSLQHKCTQYSEETDGFKFKLTTESNLFLYLMNKFSNFTLRKSVPLDSMNERFILWFLLLMQKRETYPSLHQIKCQNVGVVLYCVIHVFIKM